MTKKEQILKLIPTGKYASEIAKEVGCNPQYVRDIAWQYQLKLPNPQVKRRIGSCRYPLLAQCMAEKNITMADIGAVVYLSRWTIQSRMHNGRAFDEAEQEAIRATLFPEAELDKLFAGKEAQG